MVLRMSQKASIRQAWHVRIYDVEEVSSWLACSPLATPRWTPNDNAWGRPDCVLEVPGVIHGIHHATGNRRKDLAAHICIRTLPVCVAKN